MWVFYIWLPGCQKSFTGGSMDFVWTATTLMKKLVFTLLSGRLVFKFFKNFWSSRSESAYVYFEISKRENEICLKQGKFNCVVAIVVPRYRNGIEMETYKVVSEMDQFPCCTWAHIKPCRLECCMYTGQTMKRLRRRKVTTSYLWFIS